MLRRASHKFHNPKISHKITEGDGSVCGGWGSDDSDIQSFQLSCSAKAHVRNHFGLVSI